MLSRRINEKRASVGPMITLAIVFGLFTLVSTFIVIYAFADPEMWFMGIFMSAFYYPVFGIPLYHSIIYLIEENKNPTVPFEPVNMRISKLKQLLDEGAISQEDFEKRKNTILEEI